jgi:predicted ATP-dependent protease
VIIPASNVKHLMLRKNVRDAVAAGKFSIHAIDTVNDGIELLTGMSAGVRGDDGLFPENTVNRLVEDTLIRYAEQMRDFFKPGESVDTDQSQS